MPSNQRGSARCGTAYMYRVKRCRCRPCTDANNAANRETKRRKLLMEAYRAAEAERKRGLS